MANGTHRGQYGSPTRKVGHYLEIGAYGKQRYQYTDQDKMKEMFESCLKYGKLSPALSGRVKKALEWIDDNKT